MKKIFLLLSMTVALFGEIYEAAHFNELYSHLIPGTLVVLDIDDTLLIPAQMMGCDEWFMSRLKSKEMNESDALEKTLAEWEGVRHLTKMEIVEKGTEGIVKDLQKQGYQVMGLTTQGLALATRTKLQLLENQINLSLTCPTPEDHYYLVDGHGVLFRSGILFTSNTHKGRALFGLLDRIGLKPNKIIFINDKKSHLIPVDEDSKTRGVEFVGLRYGFSDAKKAAYDDEIANYQFNHSSFSHILSDDEAREALAPRL